MPIITTPPPTIVATIVVAKAGTIRTIPTSLMGLGPSLMVSAQPARRSAILISLLAMHLKMTRIATVALLTLTLTLRRRILLHTTYSRSRASTRLSKCRTRSTCSL